MADSTVVGLLHPGSMGSSIGGAAREAGCRVLWASEGRSEATRRRAADDGLEDAGTLGSLIQQAAVVISVCPPTAAVDVARQVVGLGFAGTYIDANAISPDTTRRIGDVAAGARYVDGGIIGGPARRPNGTHLYLSGEDAESVAPLFRTENLVVKVLDGGIGAASAQKVCFAAYTKGSMALIMDILALARAEGVESAILAEWEESIPELMPRIQRGVPGSSRKAWRWIGEMHEIADSFQAAGLPDGFHRASAAIYAALETFKDADPPPAVEDVLGTLLARLQGSATE